MSERIRLGVRTVDLQGRRVPQLYDVHTGRVVELVRSIRTESKADEAMSEITVVLYAYPENLYPPEQHSPAGTVENREHRMIDAS